MHLLLLKDLHKELAKSHVRRSPYFLNAMFSPPFIATFLARRMVTSANGLPV